METLKLNKATLPQASRLRRLNWRAAWPWFGAGLLLLIIGAWLWVATEPLRAISASGAALEAALAPGAERTQLSEAIAQLEVVAAAQPDSVLTLRRLAQGYLALNRPQAALQVLEQAAALEPDSPLLDHERARLQAILQQRDPTVWAALGHDAASLAALGDRHLIAASNEALLWYRAAQGLEPNSVPSLRMDLAAALAGDPRAIERGLVHPLEHGSVQIGAEELRWLVDRPQYREYLGVALGRNSGNNATKLWRNGSVGAFVRVVQPGRYQLSAQVREVAPAPVMMALGLDNQQIAEFRLTQANNRATIISTEIQLAQGTHLLTIWFLNDGTVAGVDRNAQVDWVAVTLHHASQ